MIGTYDVLNHRKERLRLELKQKLALTETNITEGRTSIRGIARKLHHLKRECEGLVTKEELAELERLDDLLREIEFRINDKLFDM